MVRTAFVVLFSLILCVNIFFLIKFRILVKQMYWLDTYISWKHRSELEGWWREAGKEGLLAISHELMCPFRHLWTSSSCIHAFQHCSLSLGWVFELDALDEISWIMLDVNIMFAHKAMYWASNFCTEKWCTVYKAWYLGNVSLLVNHVFK